MSLQSSSSWWLNVEDDVGMKTVEFLISMLFISFELIYVLFFSFRQYQKSSKKYHILRSCCRAFHFVFCIRSPATSYVITEQCSQPTIHWMETVAHHSMIELVSCWHWRLELEYDQYQVSAGMNTILKWIKSSIFHSGVDQHIFSDLRFQFYSKSRKGKIGERMGRILGNWNQREYYSYIYCLSRFPVFHLEDTWS